MMDPSLVASPSLIREWRRRRIQPQFSPHQTRTLLPDAMPPRTRLTGYGRPRRLRSFVYGRRLISSATDVGGNSRIRRCSSAPSTLRNKRTPPLATIPEEPTGNPPSQPISSTDSPSDYSPPHASSVDYVLEHHRRHFGGRVNSAYSVEDEGAGSSSESTEQIQRR